MKLLQAGRRGVTLVVAPHPDDEAIGAFGLIRALRRRGRPVRILVVSDGAASHPDSVAWPKTRLIAERRRETRRAMRRLGVGAADVHFLGMPDGGLTTLGRAGEQGIARAVRRVRDLALLVGPCREDAHPDHRAVAAAIAGARAPACRRFSYRIWPAASRGNGKSHRLPLGGALAKASVVRGYRTQLGGIRDDPGGFSIAPHEFRAFTRPVELYSGELACAR